MAFRDKKSGKWRANIKRGGKRSTRTFDTKRLAQQAEANNNKTETLVEIGVMDRDAADVHERGKTTVTDAIKLYAAWLEKRNRTERHRTEMKRLATKALSKCSTVADISDDALAKFVAGIEADGLSARTVRAYIVAAKAVTGWCVDHRYLASDPLRSIKAPEVTGSVRESRAFTPAEFAWLTESADANGRGDCYRFALWTGLRWSELGKVRRVDVAPRAITLPETITKNGTAAVLPVASVLTVQPSIATEPMFAVVPNRRAFLRDLRDAGVTRTGLHRKSLRLSLGTWMQAAGVSAEASDLIMRHETSVRQKHYLDRDFLINTMTEAIERTVQWYGEQINDAKEMRA